jgi:stress-induced morphogen
MFNLEVEAEQFRGLSLVKQHKLVTGILKKEIVDMVRTSPLLSDHTTLIHCS